MDVKPFSWMSWLECPNRSIPDIHWDIWLDFIGEKNTIYHIYPHLSNVAMLGFFPDLHSKMWHGQVGWYTEYTGDGRQSMTFLETHWASHSHGIPIPMEWHGMTRCPSIQQTAKT